MVFCRSFLFKLYESPKFLVSKERYVEAVKVLNQLAQMNGKTIDVNPSDLKPLIQEQNIERTGLLHFTHQMKILFDKSLYRTTCLLWTIWGTTAMGYTIFNSFLPIFLKSSGETSKSLFETYLSYLIISIFGIPGSIVGMYASDTYLGRKGAMSLATL